VALGFIASMVVVLMSAYYMSRKLTITTDIKRPLTDSRSYQAIKLSNDLKVLIISDPNTINSGACMNIQIGS